MFPSFISTLLKRLQRVALSISMLGMLSIFGIFIYGVMMSLLGKPQFWVDESVTLLSTWVVFFTAAFVLRWSEYISFDMLFRFLPPSLQRLTLILVSLSFIALIAYVSPAILDYVYFMRLAVTDMLQIPIHYVYSIFPLFLLVICLRLLALVCRLIFGNWHAALADFSAADSSEEVLL